MNREADQWLEEISAGNVAAIDALVFACDEAEELREAVAQLGHWLREDAQWRVELKRMAGWEGHKTAWDALSASIIAARGAKARPWYWLLEYADGEPLPEDVMAFFARGK